MKKLILALAIFSLFSVESFAANPDGFFLRPSASIEYSAPALSDSVSKNFKSNNFGKQISGFENIAVGGNFRVHNFLGFNANYAKGALSGHTLQSGYLNNAAHFKFSQFNLSTLAYIPLDNSFELFGEAGISNINSHLNYIQNNGAIASDQANQTKGFFGFGMQFKPCLNSQDMIRLSFQKYSGKLALLDANYSTVRIGYLKAF